MVKSKYKRRQYIVDPDFQYGLIRKICLLATLILVVSLCLLAVSYQLYGDMPVSLVMPDPFSDSHAIDAMEDQPTIFAFLWPVMSICVLATLIVTFFFGVLVSHRMAGPIFRIRRILSEIAQGDFSGSVRFRDKDAFSSLADSTNEVKQGLAKRVQELRSLCRDLEEAEGEARTQVLSSLNLALSEFKTD